MPEATEIPISEIEDDGSEANTAHADVSAQPKEIAQLQADQTADLDQKMEELQADPDFKFQPDVAGDLMIMLQYDTVATGSRLLELATMKIDELQTQPEYKVAEEKILDEQKQTDLGPEYVEKQMPLVEELKKKYEGKTTTEALDAMEEEDAELAEPEIEQELIAQEGPGEISEERKAQLKAQAKLEAKAKAKARREKFIAGLGFKLDVFIKSSVADSSFSDFMDNFFSAAVARGNGWSRYDGAFPEKDGEMIPAGEVIGKVFTSKKKLIETIDLFYEGIHQDPAYSHIEKPSMLKDPEEYKEMSNEDLQKVLSSLADLLRKEITNSNSPILKMFEHATLEVMGKDPRKSMINDQLFLTVISFGERQLAFKELVGKFTDVEQVKKPEEKPAEVPAETSASNIIQFPASEAQAAATSNSTEDAPQQAAA